MHKAKAPIFIVGAQRSGTTMLRLMLTAHPDVCVPPESMFFVQMEDNYGEGLSDTGCLDDFIEQLYENEKFSEWDVERDVLQERLRDRLPCSYACTVSEVYRTYCREADPGATRWGDKNPNYIYQLPIIFEHFPNAHVVHLIRDIRAVYNSYKSKEVIENWSYLDPNQLLQTVTKKWQQCGRVFQQYANGKRRVTHVFYEDLVRNPQSTLRAICDDIELSYSREMLYFHQKNREEELVPNHRREWHEKTFQPVDPGRAVAWKDSLSCSEIEALECLNEVPLKRFGYSFQSSPPRYRGRWLLLTRRISRILSHYASKSMNRIPIEL